MSVSHIKVEDKGNVRWIYLSKERTYNAITGQMYNALSSAFDEAENDDDIMLTVLTGTGKYYSAGSDFSPAEMSENMGADVDSYNPYKLWVDKLIRHSKPVIALVNGPAIGIAVTTLALCDAVIASDAATFVCPFTQIGVNPEAGSSRTFVDIMGYQKAAQLALFAEKMTAQEAYVAGLVAKVIPHAVFKEETEKIVARYSKLSKQSILVSKRLMRPPQMVEKLLSINRQEYEVLMKQMSSEDTLERLLAKFGKSKM